MRRAAVLALALVTIAALAACGKKGDPVPPPGEPNVWPRFYPNPAAVPAAPSEPAKPAAPSTPP